MLLDVAARLGNLGLGLVRVRRLGEERNVRPVVRVELDVTHVLLNLRKLLLHLASRHRPPTALLLLLIIIITIIVIAITTAAPAICPVSWLSIPVGLALQLLPPPHELDALDKLDHVVPPRILALLGPLFFFPSLALKLADLLLKNRNVLCGRAARRVTRASITGHGARGEGGAGRRGDARFFGHRDGFLDIGAARGAGGTFPASE